MYTIFLVHSRVIMSVNIVRSVYSLKTHSHFIDNWADIAQRL
jgi:hypothetical protein